MVLEEKSQMLNRGKNEHVQELQVEIGKTISEQRVRKGLTIQQVESVTKISQTFIDDIEQGNFDKLPGKIFCRGFIKSICIMLEIDPVPVLEKYERSWLCIPEVKESKTPRSFSFFPRERKLITSSFSPFRNLPVNRFALTLLVPVFIVFLVFVVRYVADKRSGDITPVSSAPKATEPAPTASAPSAVGTPASSQELSPAKASESSLAAAVSEKVELVAQPIPVATVKEEPKKEKFTKELPVKTAVETKKAIAEAQKPLVADPAAAASDGRAVVILNVKEEVKIKHRVLPDDYTTTTFTPGVYRFPFEDRVDLLLFDASAVDVSFNNKSLGVLGKKGEERKLTFFAKDLKPEADAKRM